MTFIKMEQGKRAGLHALTVMETDKAGRGFGANIRAAPRFAAEDLPCAAFVRMGAFELI
jgi:hypothetical protein